MDEAELSPRLAAYIAGRMPEAAISICAIQYQEGSHEVAAMDTRWRLHVVVCHGKW